MVNTALCQQCHMPKIYNAGVMISTVPNNLKKSDHCSPLNVEQQQAKVKRLNNIIVVKPLWFVLCRGDELCE